MRAYLGEPIGIYILRARLGAAVNLIRLTDLPIAVIALRVGYENPNSFKKAFRKWFGYTPSFFRESTYLDLPFNHIKLKKAIMNGISMQPTYKNLPNIKVVYAPSRGPYNKSAKEAWDKVCSSAGPNGLFSHAKQFIEISYDDSKITEADKCRYEACLTVANPIKEQGNIAYKEIPGGKFAVFLAKGPHSRLIHAYDYIYGKWIEENRIVPRDANCMEFYLNSPDEEKPLDLTEIYIPVN